MPAEVKIDFQLKFKISKSYACMARRTAASHVGTGPTSLLVTPAAVALFSQALIALFTYTVHEHAATQL